MGISLPAALAMLLVLLGFHGVLIGKTPLRRSLAWCLLQAGPCVLALSLGLKEDPLGQALALILLVVGGLVASVLCFLAKLQPTLPKERKGRAR